MYLNLGSRAVEAKSIASSEFDGMIASSTFDKDDINYTSFALAPIFGETPLGRMTAIAIMEKHCQCTRICPLFFGDDSAFIRDYVDSMY